MARPPKIRLPKIKRPIPSKPKINKRSATPIIYYGGKSRDVAAIVNQFPPHEGFCDVFGGGGPVTFYKPPSALDIYNDIGNVVNFMEVLKDYGDELYDWLYHTNWSRQMFYHCVQRWQSISDDITKIAKASDKPYLELFKLEPELAIEWAGCWYTVIIQGYSHSENETSWKVAKQVDTARSWNNHVDELPEFTKILRTKILECLDFKRLIELYDGPDMLFYCDPPYISSTRKSKNDYMHEMPLDQHQVLLNKLNNIKGQAVVSMYDHHLYNEQLTNDRGWRRKEIKHMASIHNTSVEKSALDGRTEVLWIKERAHGLWAESDTWNEVKPSILPRVEV